MNTPRAGAWILACNTFNLPQKAGIACEEPILCQVRLETLGREDQVQATMVATWLLELLLDKQNRAALGAAEGGDAGEDADGAGEQEKVRATDGRVGAGRICLNSAWVCCCRGSNPDRALGRCPAVPARLSPVAGGRQPPLTRCLRRWRRS